MKNQSLITNNFTFLYWSGFLIGLGFMLWYANNQVMTGDQLQMIYKGYLGAYQDQWLQYGNAASAVGNVPGPLSALVIGMPLLVWDSPYAPMAFLLALHAISFFLLDSIVKQVYSKEIRLTFLVLYWLNPWFLFESELYNPAYLFFFSALHIFTAFHLRTDRSLSFSFLHLLSIGMAMQLHYSWVVLAVISSYLFYRKLIKLNWFGIAIATGFLIYSLMPYFQELLINKDLQINPGNANHEHYIGWGVVHVYPVIKAILYWLRYASFFFNSFLLSDVSFVWLTDNKLIQTAFVYTYKIIIFTIGLFTVWLSYRANKFTFQKIRPLFFRSKEKQKVGSEEWLLLFAFGSFVAVVISSALSPIVFNYWHLIIVFPFALIPLLSYINQKQQHKYFVKYLMLVVMYFLMVNIIAANDSRKYSYKVNYHKQTMQYLMSNKLVKIK
jgi:hypothetical protein